ncbi:MAG TPA: STAS domain-containing protein [Mycobacteriales bacterium]|jgi:anti-anti-sigma regulatory factor|nr:STAS domain-containing protein [Mycobacteriales bacterium]
MTTATLEATGHVDCVHLADGLLVRLGGSLTTNALPELRGALLAPLDEGCRDVVVDAGEVTGIDDEVLAVLLAARVWAEDHGARMLLSRTAPALESTLEELSIAGALPRLAAVRRAMPKPRVAVD